MSASGLGLLWPTQHVHNCAAIRMDRRIVVGTHGGFDDVITRLLQASRLIGHDGEHVVGFGCGDIGLSGIAEPNFGIACRALFQTFVRLLYDFPVFGVLLLLLAPSVLSIVQGEPSYAAFGGRPSAASILEAHESFRRVSRDCEWKLDSSIVWDPGTP